MKHYFFASLLLCGLATGMFSTSAHAVTTRNEAFAFGSPAANNVKENFWVTLSDSQSTWQGVKLRISGPGSFFNEIDNQFTPPEGGAANTEYGPAFAIWTNLQPGTYICNGTAYGKTSSNTAWYAGSSDRSVTVSQ